ncbi:hypothetical protein Btru_077660 [Bulinus truncatus]|nr:hypothetical protein Btru_077660 [Bulinus truncatus]
MPQLKMCTRLYGLYTRSDRMIHIAKLSFNPFQKAFVSPVTGVNFLTHQKWQHLVKRHFKMESMIKKKVMKPNHYRDKIPRDYTMIYENHLKYWILGVKLVPMVTGLLFSSYCLIYHEDINSIFSLRDKIIVLSVVGIFGIGAIYVNLLARKYVLRIYHNDGQFIAVRRSIFGRLKQLKYNLNEVSYKANENPDIHLGCEIIIKNSKCLLFASDFISSVYYNLHLGDYSSLHSEVSDLPKF